MSSPIRRHPVAAFLVLACALTWAVWIPAIVALPADVPTLPFVLVGGFGPAVAAAVLTRATGGSLRSWVAGMATWRVAPRWYLAALGVPVVTVVVASTAYGLVTGAPLRASRAVTGLPVFLAGVPFVFLVSGGNEEPGWRGFALPRLQRRHGALVASLLVGAGWAVWHLPLHVLGTDLTAGSRPFPLYAAWVISLSVVFTWLYNSTDGSVVLPMLLHAANNSALAVAVVPTGVPGDFVGFTVAMTATNAAIAVVVVLAYGPETLCAGEKRVATTGRSGTTGSSRRDDGAGSTGG